MVVAVAVGQEGVDSLLVISQVILSIVLPFITLPLILLTSSKSVMQVVNDEADGRSVVDYSSSLWVTLTGLALWLVVLIANMYVIVTLAIG